MKIKVIVVKSNGQEQEFNLAKLRTSILKAYESANKSPSNIEEIIDLMKASVEQFINEDSKITSNDLWDLVEKILVQSGDFDVAKSYILYRWKAHCEKETPEDKKFKINVIKKDGSKQKFNIKKIKKIFDIVSKDTPECTFDEFEQEIKKYLIDNITTTQLAKLLVKSAVDKVTIENTSWQQIAWRLFLFSIYKQASRNLNVKVKDLYLPKNYVNLFNEYIDNKLYFRHFKRFYKEEDILQAWKYINPERDFDYGYTTILMYNKRYLLNPNKVVKEIPQQMYMSAALFLAIPEGLDKLRIENWKLNNSKQITDKELLDLISKVSEKDWEIINNENKTLEDILEISDSVLLHPWLRKIRFDIAKKIYDYTSTWKISLPTPTLLNARTNFHQLSSCFKFNIDDDLRSIYHTVENMAQISKFGGWIGSYLGHIRAKWSSIRNVKWASGGVLPWIKVMNDTAIAVNQLGARAGAISVTIDAWHLDIMDFLEMQTETGDIRRKAFDVFPAVSIPDLFMKRVINNENWTLFDPKEVRDTIWTKLEDHFWEDFEKLYLELEQRDDLEMKEIISAKDLFKQILRTVVETGMPYIFFRDTSNKYNPNKHVGNVYSTQLCTEIIQNTSESIFVEEKTEDGLVAIKYKPGDTVVCNLASINVAKVNQNTGDMEDVHNIAMRILDNVITMNFYPVEETKLTAMKYRSVWLGYMWLSEYLATQAKLRYDSSQAVEHVDKLFEQYAYFTLKASVELAKERWRYSLFEGSDWSKGILFGKDEKWFSENSEYATDWLDLIQKMKKYGTRFAYHQAPAPNTSTALVVGTTAGLLPVYKKYFVETNSAAPTVNVAPNLSKENFWFYKEYVHMNMSNVIDMISTIQKWIDQSISFEWIINPMEVSPADLYSYYLKGWEQGLKTVYYVRSMSLEVEKCESCAG